MDFKKRKAVFTGAEVPEFHGELVGEDYIIIGNLLSDKKVIDSMAEQFENSREDLALRMLEALRAGSKAGGDIRGEKSAALIVVGSESVVLQIGVNKHPQPIEELHRKLETLGK